MSAGTDAWTKGPSVRVSLKLVSDPLPGYRCFFCSVFPNYQPQSERFPYGKTRFQDGFAPWPGLVYTHEIYILKGLVSWCFEPSQTARDYMRAENKLHLLVTVHANH